jgi:hypothetical protein
MAYMSNESKGSEVYVAGFPAMNGKWQISANGGRWPVWSRDGRELYFVGGDNKLMAVPHYTRPAVSTRHPAAAVRRAYGKQQPQLRCKRRRPFFDRDVRGAIRQRADDRGAQLAGGVEE